MFSATTARSGSGSATPPVTVPGEQFWVAQRHSAEVAFGYLSALASEVKANCWSAAEEAGHEGPHRMQALLGTYRWGRKKAARQATLRGTRRGSMVTDDHASRLTNLFYPARYPA